MSEDLSSLPGSFVADTLVNFVAGMGTDKDKVTHGRFHKRAMTKGELDAMYESDWLAGTIIDAPCDDMTREWRQWKAGPRQIEQLEAEEARLSIRSRVNQGLKLGRLYGGAALLIGGPGDPSTELTPDMVGKGGIQFVHVLSRHELTAQDIIRDPLDKYFGEPSSYTLDTTTVGAVNVHPSRVIRLFGQARLEILTSQDGWGLPTLERVYEAVRNASSTASNLASLTHEAKVDVVKIKGLTQNISSQEYRNKLLLRFTMANQAKSVNNMLILDELEEWQQKQVRLSEFPAVLRLFLDCVAGAANIPATRLLSSTPGGLNNNNEGSVRHYYDTLSSKQEVDLRPALSRLDELLIRSATGARDPKIWYEFLPLWQLTVAEQMAVAIQAAQTTQIYALLGIMPPDALRECAVNQLREQGIYPGIDEVMEKYVGKPAAPLIDPATKPVDNPHVTGRVVSHASTGDAGIKDMEPKTLYVHRKVTNPNDLVTWAKSQGFDTTLKPSDMHVTIIYSKEPLDWFKAGEDYSDKIRIPAGGPRIIEKFGDNAIVLQFACDQLRWRHDALKRAGAKSDYDEYQPHITITYNPPAGMNINEIEPYTGPIMLGPEIFKEIKGERKEPVPEKSTSAVKPRKTRRV